MEVVAVLVEVVALVLVEMVALLLVELVALMLVEVVALVLDLFSSDDLLLKILSRFGGILLVASLSSFDCVKTQKY